MASSSISESSNPFGATERTGGSGAVPKSLKTNVESESMATERKSEEREHFSASESFYQRMETMINKEDVQSILDKQKETLTKFEKTNAKFGRFNDLSAARFLHLNQQLRNHTKMLLDMKKDLDSVFRRIRTVKAKLAKQYGPAFHAISAGIQRLEEELGASIENEDVSSMDTLSEKRKLDHESQTSDQQLVVGQQSTDQDTKEDISQEDIPVVTCSTTSELRTHNDQSEDRTAASLDIASAKTERVEIIEDYFEPENATVEKTEGFNSQDTDNGSLRDALSVQKSKDINSTVDTDEINRTTDTSDVIRSVDTNDTRTTVDTSDSSETVDTSDLIGTVDKGDASRTSEPVDTCGTVDTSNMNLTVDTSDVTRSLDSSADTSGTVDTSDITETEQERK